ncbi:hypothetical protein A2111_03045 [Candidatus Daviesbacteria bacterium GWA1_38_6]|nr:MAG: hypothetical protein A2111_03045 [Candidatus Daviesbacteria bacterium GWA1_38_6]
MRRPPWYSSYEENNYGELFYSLVRIYQPEKVVELGTKAGFSAYHIARGLKANGHGSLDCYDLWEHEAMYEMACKNLKGLEKIVKVNRHDAIGVDTNYKSIDILHVDLGNEGGILEKTIPLWIDKTRQLIIIEGGSIERDKRSWMINLGKTPIRSWLEEFSRLRTDIEYFTFDPFPSVTIIRKK